jgi:hypothetical protein
LNQNSLENPIVFLTKIGRNGIMGNPRLAKIKKDRNCPTEIGKEYRELGITHQDWNEWSQKSSSKQQ